MAKQEKPKNGYDRLKIKYAKLEAEKNELQTVIERQSSSISQYEADAIRSDIIARELRSKYEKAVEHMGWLRRLWYGYYVPPFRDDDHWSN